MQYSKITYPIAVFLAILAVSSCSNDADEVEIRADGKVRVGVGVNMANTVEVTTRAAEGYSDFGGSTYNGWTMGVFAVNNEGIESGSASYLWDDGFGSWYSDLWVKEASYDFYSYIPYSNEAKSVEMITENSQAKLMITEQPAFSKKDLLASVAAGTGSTLTDGSFTAEVSGTTATHVYFRMNHLLAKLRLQFQLPTVNHLYDDLRRIEIKSVTLSSSVNQSKTYNISFDYKGSRTPVYTASATADKAVITLDYSQKVDENTTLTTLSLPSDDSQPALFCFDGDQTDIFLVPDIVNKNNQTLSLTIKYNVYTKNQENGEYVLTRENATATNNSIVVYKDDGIASADIEAGKAYTVNIKIIPSYLYVLADIDQSSSIVLQ